MSSHPVFRRQLSKSIAVTGILLCALILQGCGFKLRGSQALPETLNTVLINSSLQYSPMSRALNRRLPVYQLNGIIANTSDVEELDTDSLVVINLSPENLERRLLSVFSSGQVAEYELIYTVNYQVTFPGAQTISNAMSVSREYQDDPQQILAKSRELELVMAEMRLETADRIIRLLSSQYTLAANSPSSN